MAEKDPREIYQTPLTGRYCSDRMQYIWSDANKFKKWRMCWHALAEAQHELGLPQITLAHVEELKRASEEPIDYDFAAAEERKMRHDVMAHLNEFRRHCPTAAPIIHLGATSMEPGDNGYLMQLREAVQTLKAGYVNTLSNLGKFALANKNLVTLAFTHFQAAQPTTMGKRASLWAYDLLFDLENLERAEGYLSLARGAKGTTGTQDSFLALFDGDVEKVIKLDELFAKKLGFSGTQPVSGQTYTRKIDALVAGAVGSLGSSAHKFSLDLRLLAHRKELEEPFEKDQVGSSAMPYKRNPMRSERMTGLSRKLMSEPPLLAGIHANQWLERTLDDSAQMRIDIPETFLLADAILILYQNITSGLVVHPKVIEKNLIEELPFMATERVIIEACKHGADRQVVHESIREHSMASGLVIKDEGKPNDLFERLAADEKIVVSRDYLDGLLTNPSQFAGLAAKQTEKFVDQHINPVLEKYKDLVGRSQGEVKV